MASNVQDYLIESLRQNKDHYKNVINASHPFPCGICQKNVNGNQKAIECSMCNYWIHIKCNGTTKEDYHEMIKLNLQLTEEEIESQNWFCCKCEISNLAEIFPFGLQDNYELINILNADSLKFIANLPSFETISKVREIESLNQYDIDENIVNNINSRYYTVEEFKTLNKKSNFNILHSNINGLENKFEEYHHFINSTNMNIDILCISETSQKENISLSSNISIDGYKNPFALVLSHLGGVLLSTLKNI